MPGAAGRDRGQPQACEGLQHASCLRWRTSRKCPPRWPPQASGPRWQHGGAHLRHGGVGLHHIHRHAMLLEAGAAAAVGRRNLHEPRRLLRPRAEAPAAAAHVIVPVRWLLLLLRGEAGVAPAAISALQTVGAAGQSSTTGRMAHQQWVQPRST